ncbi:hypothetical protein E4U54_003376 [Claviceps lovelessii]|nr:hypothetical protein E4U54_003376 [Claviceps lovelessii]
MGHPESTILCVVRYNIQYTQTPDHQGGTQSRGAVSFASRRQPSRTTLQTLSGTHVGDACEEASRRGVLKLAAVETVGGGNSMGTMRDDKVACEHDGAWQRRCVAVGGNGGEVKDASCQPRVPDLRTPSAKRPGGLSSGAGGYKSQL